MALLEEESKGPLGAGVDIDARPDIEVIPSASQPRRAKRPNALIEIAWLVFLIWIYDWLQDLAPVRRAVAKSNAEAMLSFEKSLGLDPEKALDHWLAHHQVLAFISSNFYDNAIFAVTFGFAVYLYWKRPELYPRLRNSLVLANLIAFVVFWALPVAPPRMLPGFIDVVEKVGGLGSWHDTLIKHADQLAAMPSMHLGYSVWCGVAAWQIARDHRGKVRAVVFAVAYPSLTALVVMGTGNHYLLDVVAGTATTLASVALVEAVPLWWRSRSVRYQRPPT